MFESSFHFGCPGGFNEEVLKVPSSFLIRVVGHITYIHELVK